MSGNLKAPGLAMVAALALSAVAASAAQAVIKHHFTVPAVPAIITANQDEKTLFKITGEEFEFFCETTKYDATVTEKTNKSITVTPTYSGCKVVGPFGNIALTTDVNHCAYVFEEDTDVNGDAGLEIECGPEQDITTTYEVFGAKCVIHVTPGTYRGVHYTGTTNLTTGKKDITVKFTVSGIKYHETDPGATLCPNNATGEDGTLTGAATAEAFTEKTTAENANCVALTGTAKTTPTATYYNECEKAVQDLELNENVTLP